MRPALDRHFGSSGHPHHEEIARRLRELPCELEAPYEWAEFRRRACERAWSRRGSAVRWRHAAAAAAVTLLIAAMAILGRSSQPPGLVESNKVAAHSREPADGSASGALEGPMQPEINARAIGDGARLAATAAAAIAARRSAVARAEASQRWLARQPAEPAVVRVGPRMAVANLEDRIAWVDDALTDERFSGVDATRVDALQQERARLVNSLAQVRYAETLAVAVP